MRIEFSIGRWAAWAPGLETQEAWARWAQHPSVPSGPGVPPLAEVPPMARRRIERLARTAFQVAAWCEGDERGLPLVFASRHGDVVRSVELLEALARGDLLSPTSFALSVHNAVGGQYSITRKDTANVTCVANGRWTPEAGLVEAMTLLDDGADEALLVMYDAGLGSLSDAFTDEPQADYAWCWRLRRGADFALETVEPPAPPRNGLLPHGLEVLRFALGSSSALESGGEGPYWRWTRRG